MRDITQANLYLILPSKVSRMATMMSEDSGMGILDAIRHIYHSGLYRQLEIESTKLWHEGPVALYDDMKGANS